MPSIPGSGTQRQKRTIAIHHTAEIDSDQIVAGTETERGIERGTALSSRGVRGAAVNIAILTAVAADGSGRTRLPKQRQRMSIAIGDIARSTPRMGTRRISRQGRLETSHMKTGQDRHPPIRSLEDQEVVAIAAAVRSATQMANNVMRIGIAIVTATGTHASQVTDHIAIETMTDLSGIATGRRTAIATGIAIEIGTGKKGAKIVAIATATEIEIGNTVTAAARL